MSKISGDINKHMMRDSIARAVNQPALELIADVLEEHTNGVLAGIREKIDSMVEQRKQHRLVLRQALDALQYSGKGRNLAVDEAITAIEGVLK